MTIFEEVKKLIDVPTAARHYGVEVHRGNMALCPFHRERTPSMKLYERNYHCFGCQAHGDVINLVQELFGLTPIEAVRQLNSDFGLCIDVDCTNDSVQPPDKQLIRERKKALKREKAEQLLRENMYDTLLRYFTLLDKYRIKYAPISPDNEVDERYIYSVHNIEYAAFLLETFDRTDRKQFEEMKQEVIRIGREYSSIVKKWGN